MTLYCTNGHHDLTISHWSESPDTSRRIALTLEWLDRPILNVRDEPMENKGASEMIKAALRALAKLDGCDATVSFHVVNIGNGYQIKIPYREWCKISFAIDPTETVLDFSHHPLNSSPFYYMEEWLDDKYPEGMALSAMRDFYGLWSTEDAWVEFFRKEIQQRVIPS